jgi:hypothetical protein
MHIICTGLMTILLIILIQTTFSTAIVILADSITDTVRPFRRANIRVNITPITIVAIVAGVAGPRPSTCAVVMTLMHKLCTGLMTILQIRIIQTTFSFTKPIFADIITDTVPPFRRANISVSITPSTIVAGVAGVI